MRPFLRWAGGKRWLAMSDRLKLPTMSRYVEPFVGGGAVFFAQSAERALLSDLNKYLINTYSWMKSSPRALFEQCSLHFDRHSATYFYETRKRLGSDTLVDAASFLYLNRACFNGLFRVNLDGRFNVPIGTKLFELRDVVEFDAWGQRLASAELVCGDFEKVIDGCGDGDFLFVDPPYTVKHNANGFIEYNEKIFSWDDQVRLANCIERAKQRGASFLLTNADHDSVKALYPADWVFGSAERGSEMASKTAYRGRTTELLAASSADIIEGHRLI